MEMTLDVEVDSPAAANMVLDTLGGTSDENAQISPDAMTQSINLAKNVANIAGDMSPDELSSAGSKILKSSAKFSSGIEKLDVTPDKAADTLASVMANEKIFTQVI